MSKLLNKKKRRDNSSLRKIEGLLIHTKRSLVQKEGLNDQNWFTLTVTLQNYWTYRGEGGGGSRVIRFLHVLKLLL